MAPQATGDVPTAHYCGRDCQKADWNTHKALCNRLKDRTTVYRMVETARKLYFIHRELSWTGWDIQEIKDQVPGLWLPHSNPFILFGTAHPDEHWPEDYRVFPSKLMASKIDKDAILSWLCCQDAVLWMIEFAKGWLKDLVAQIEVVNLNIRNILRRIYFLDRTTRTCNLNQGLQHQILKVKLRSGEFYAIDITGAQYGYSAPFVPWEAYVTQRDAHIIDSEVAPAANHIIKTDDYSLAAYCAAASGGTGQSPKFDQLGLQSLVAVNVYMLDWQNDTRCPLKSIWKQNPGDFEKQQNSLVDYIEWWYHKLPHKWGTVNGRRLKSQYASEWELLKRDFDGLVER